MNLKGVIINVIGKDKKKGAKVSLSSFSMIKDTITYFTPCIMVCSLRQSRNRITAAAPEKPTKIMK